MVPVRWATSLKAVTRFMLLIVSAAGMVLLVAMRFATDAQLLAVVVAKLAMVLKFSY